MPGYALGINVKTAFDMIQNKDVIVIDVRTPEEYAETHIEGALNIDVNGDFLESVKALDKTKKYIIYCRSGRRSAAAEKQLINAGFEEIYNVEGGILDWKENGLPVVK